MTSTYESTDESRDLAGISPAALRSAVWGGATAAAEFRAKLASPFDGALVQIVGVTHTKTVLSAYAVRLADDLAGGKASTDTVREALRPLGQSGVSIGCISQYRNAAKVLVDLEWPLTDPTVGPMLRAARIARPLAVAMLAKRRHGIEAGRAVFGEEMAKEMAETDAINAKRAIVTAKYIQMTAREQAALQWFERETVNLHDEEPLVADPEDARTITMLVRRLLSGNGPS